MFWRKKLWIRCSIENNFERRKFIDGRFNRVSNGKVYDINTHQSSIDDESSFFRYKNIMADNRRSI